MSLLAFLLRRSRAIVVASIATAAISGLGGVALIAMIQHELARTAPSRGMLGLAFAGLCVLVAGTRVAAQVMMARLGQGTVTELATKLCRDLLRLPLERFERLDSSRLLAVLTEDIVIVSGTLSGIPQLAINVPLVAICLAYTGWLSPVILAYGTLFAAAAIAAYVALVSPAVQGALPRAARAGQDALVGHFRTLIDGFRELKLHSPRREAFLSRALLPAAARVRDRSVAGQTLFALAEGWGELAFFGFLGFLLFVLPALHPIDRPALVGAVLVVLYVMGPLDVVLTWMPALGRARASISRIEGLIPATEAYDADGADRARPLREESLTPRGDVDPRLPARTRRGRLPPRPHRPDLAPRRDRDPGRRQRQRQDHAREAPRRPLRPERGLSPARRPRDRRRRPRGVSRPVLGRLRRRPPVPRPPRPGAARARRRGDGGAGAVRDCAGARPGPRRRVVRRSTCRRASAGGWPSSRPASNAGRSACSTNGPPTRIHSRVGLFIARSCPN